ncbi:Maf family protein [Nesterenkonia alkaliphila]|uniref:Nucleoside triphosphate pyrophosphatase n=1 Tax=Nesterenkonia alkaliphila TaxID=1463631 RepID=A0A7K1UKD1_9MICC|nr:Maf family protein [Nesterenkonia alkaliphila]MVT26782.1 septum formation inhibitor Maf [Nesterenkonia alkaliphila]GFZ77339.1 hypothetical protein GCM10011359_01920 [Nesterenkonia alkaliphila]
MSTHTPRLILASASPSRRMILEQAGISFEVVVSEVDEPVLVEQAVEAGGPLSPAEEAELLARAKAEDVAAKPEARGALVLGCDSVFELDGTSYGKPYKVEVAVQRWRQMRGRTGHLHTGHWLVDARAAKHGAPDKMLSGFLKAIMGEVPQGPSGELPAASETVSSQVHFGTPTDAQIRSYCESGEPLHCAGAFTLEGGAAEFIDRVDGDREAVIGVSPAALGRLLEQLGHSIKDFHAPPSEGGHK